MRNAFRVMLRILLTLAAIGLAPATHAIWVSSAPAPFSPKAAQVEAFRLVRGAKSVLRIDLGAADAGAIEAVRIANGVQFEKRLQIGVGRPLPVQADTRSESLRWERVSDGVAAQWEITSAGASALRIGLDVARMSPMVQIRFAGSGDIGTVYGPVSVADIQAMQPIYWSPVLEGERATVEVFVADGGSPGDVSLAISQLSHLFVSPKDANAEALAKASGSCEVDLICLSASDAALASVGNAVARMTFIDYAQGGGTFLCTGTLLNTTAGPVAPYFYSANHCISTQASASTLTTHWFYDRTGCGAGGTSSAYVQVTGGATLLYNNDTSDVLLLSLSQNPPSGAIYAGWDASTLSTGTAMTAVHHPQGDLKKVSLGTAGGFSGYGGGSGDDHIIALWNSTATGVTEGGSSGSGIFTNAGQGYLLRGGLHGGPSSCTATGTSLRDYYSRFDRAYSFVSQYLNPGTSCTYSLSPSSGSVGSGATSGSFSVTTSSGCSWTASSSVTWITTSSSGSGSGTVQYSVAANTGSARTGTISVGGQTFTVSQQAGQGGSTTSVVTNGGFESGSSSWTQSNGSIIYTDGIHSHLGNGYAWLGGYDNANESLYQDVTIPSGASQVTLRYWYSIATQETSTSTAYDTMQVLIQNPSSGATLATVASYSNLNATAGWVQSPAFDLSAFAGQTVRLRFTATTDPSINTNFFVDDVTFTVVTTGTSVNYTALWLNPAEAGWGLNINHQGNMLFTTLFTYDSTGQPLWLHMSGGALQPDGSYSGTLYRTTGPAFNAVPFTPISFPANYLTVGTMSVTFTSSTTGTLTYSVNGAVVTKSILRYSFGTRATVCVPTTGSRDSLTNYQDLWLNLSEAGWGVNVSHEDNTLFATLFTYDASGHDLWLVMSGGVRQADGSYLGDLYRTTGPAFNAVPFTPIVYPNNYTNVGTMRFTFTGGKTGTLTYSVNGSVVTKAITRYEFSSPLPACS